MPSRIETAILETLVYYDLFSYPLTTLEIWNYLHGGAATYGEVHRALQESTWLARRMAQKNGVWFLKGRDAIVVERQSRYRASKYKIDRARRFARLARFLPWIQTIAACNSLGFLQARRESDIDLFVVTRRGRLWSTRFFMVFLAKLFGRPGRAHIQDGICLSFFATSGANLRKLALPGGDVYYEQWLKNLLPLYIKAKPWVSPRLSLGNLGERMLRFVQLKMLPAQLKTLVNQGMSVVINDEILKFHDHDRRDYYRKEFAKRLAAVGA